MSEFDRHKEPLLSILRGAYDCGPKLSPSTRKNHGGGLKRQPTNISCKKEPNKKR